MTPPPNRKICANPNCRRRFETAHWNNTAKYCSHACANSDRRGKMLRSDFMPGSPLSELQIAAIFHGRRFEDEPRARRVGGQWHPPPMIDPRNVAPHIDPTVIAPRQSRHRMR